MNYTTINAFTVTTTTNLLFWMQSFHVLASTTTAVAFFLH